MSAVHFPLASRVVQNTHGMDSLQLQMAGGRQTFLRVPQPQQREVKTKQLSRKVHMVRDFMSWVGGGVQQVVESVHQRLYKFLKPDHHVNIQVPKYGTLTLKTDVVLSKTQLRVMARIFADWGENFLQGWRTLRKQENHLKFPLAPVVFMDLVVGTTTEKEEKIESVSPLVQTSLQKSCSCTSHTSRGTSAFSSSPRITK
jgi:hypothetical protein